MAQSDIVKVKACLDKDIAKGQFVEVALDENSKALLIRDSAGELHAVGSRCTHFGLPLSKGVLSEDGNHIRCPFHGACFNVKTGDIEDSPGLDSLPKYQVTVESSGQVIIHANRNMMQSGFRRTLHMTSMTSQDPVYVIIGGGGAGSSAAECLRQEGFTGRIILLTREKNLPYDRTKLSKNMKGSVESIQLRGVDFYKKYNIDIRTGALVKSVDARTKQVFLHPENSAISYSKLLVASGASPRVLNVPGSELRNVCQLRTPEDSARIHELSSGKHLLLVGASFISMEIAASLQGHAASVTVLGRKQVPFAESLGNDVGLMLKSLHEEKGIKFVMEDELISLENNGSGVVCAGVLASGRRVPADVVVAGIGVVPESEFIQENQVKKDRGYIVVNEMMETSCKDVYAAGDIVKFPLKALHDMDAPMVKIGHWGLAQIMGRSAARSMMSHNGSMRNIPFFWTAQFGLNVRFAGYNVGHQETVTYGSAKDKKCAVMFIKNEKVVAVCSVSFDPICARFAEYIRSGKIIRKSDIESVFAGLLN